MTRSDRGFRQLLGLFVAFSLALGWAATPPVPAAAAEPALSTWDGGVSLYRKGVFTTQRSWLWCTAAGVQIVRNIVDGEEDHTTSAQRRYFTWMREHNRYTLPLSAGVDPQGWTAGLRHFVDDRYRLVVSTTFDNALRSAVKRIRLTNLPVALTVAHGNHGWILSGFTATADPATTASFKVTSVRVVGPLYGLQSRNGYDMPPNTKLTPTQLKRFFTPWKYAPKAMIWDGRWVSIQPVPATTASSAPASTAPKTEPLVAMTTSSLSLRAATQATSPTKTIGQASTAASAGVVSPARGSGRPAGGTGTASEGPVIGATVILLVGAAVAAVRMARAPTWGGGRRGTGSSARVPG